LSVRPGGGMAPQTASRGGKVGKRRINPFPSDWKRGARGITGDGRGEDVQYPFKKRPGKPRLTRPGSAIVRQGGGQWRVPAGATGGAGPPPAGGHGVGGGGRPGPGGGARPHPRGVGGRGRCPGPPPGGFPGVGPRDSAKTTENGPQPDVFRPGLVGCSRPSHHRGTGGGTRGGRGRRWRDIQKKTGGRRGGSFRTPSDFSCGVLPAAPPPASGHRIRRDTPARAGGPNVPLGPACHAFTTLHPGSRGFDPPGPGGPGGSRGPRVEHPGLEGRGPGFGPGARPRWFVDCWQHRGTGTTFRLE